MQVIDSCLFHMRVVDIIALSCFTHEIRAVLFALRINLVVLVVVIQNCSLL